MAEVLQTIEEVSVPQHITDALAEAELRNPKPDAKVESTIEKTELELLAEKNAKIEAENILESKIENEPISKTQNNFPADDEMSDEDLLKLLEKKGITAPSIESLKAKPVVPSDEEQADDRKNKVTAWALENKKTTTKQIQEFGIESQLPKNEVAFNLYKEERKNDLNLDDEPITIDELREQFEEENFLNEESTDPRRIRAEKKLTLIAENYLYSKYKTLNDLDEAYDFELSSKENSTKKEQNLSIAKQSVIDNGGYSFTIKNSKGEDFTTKLPISKTNLDKIVTQLQNSPIFIQGQDADDTKQYSSALELAVKAHSFDSLLMEFATAYHSNEMLILDAKSIGITPRNTNVDTAIEGEVPKHIQQALLEAEQRRKNN